MRNPSEAERARRGMTDCAEVLCRTCASLPNLDPTKTAPARSRSCTGRGDFADPGRLELLEPLPRGGLERGVDIASTPESVEKVEQVGEGVRLQETLEEREGERVREFCLEIGGRRPGVLLCPAAAVAAGRAPPPPLTPFFLLSTPAGLCWSF